MMKTHFEVLLKQELLKNSRNQHADNFDYLRYSNRKNKPVINTLKELTYSTAVYSLLLNTAVFRKYYYGNFGLYPFLKALDSMYSLLEDQESKDLLVLLIGYKILGYKKVKLPFNTADYWTEIAALDKAKRENDTITLNTFPWSLNKFELKPFGFDYSMYLTTINCYISILREHYKHNISGGSIEVEPGDTVLDLGACFGDTALYFADKIGPNGHVYSFEFIPGNMDMFHKNVALNPHLQDRIHLVDQPVWSEKDKAVFFDDNGPGSKVQFETFEGVQGESTTITVDALAEREDLKVDFIKADIEGAEPFMLEGAVETLKRDKPKLAISIYHSMEDFTNIIQQIDGLNLGYKFYLGHATIHSEETVLFCKA